MRAIPGINSLIIKIGSNILADTSQGINGERVQRIADVVAGLKSKIPEITVVSSGAIAAGFKMLGFKKRPKEVIDKQACAAAGQTRLMWYYEQAFEKHNLHAAQILITKADFSNRNRYLNARATIRRLLELNAVPVINENDTVVVNELKYVESFGDNDNLSALVAGLIDADLLMILSDVDGLYTADPTVNPDAELITDLDEIDSDVMRLAGVSSSGVGTGGMHSKLSAASKALQAGCRVVILNGRQPENIIKFLNGEQVGTFFRKPVKSAGSKKLWITYATIPKGTVVVDNGARKAITEQHKSLLPSGITSVTGTFGIGDIVDITDTEGVKIAVGKVRYSSSELNMIKRKRSGQIAEILGRKCPAFVVHCDEMGFSK